MAAEHAAELSEKSVRVSAARSQQTGLAAALALDPQRSAADNVAAIDAAIERLRTGAVAPAARDDGDGRFVAGDAVGFVDDAIFAWASRDRRSPRCSGSSAKTPSCSPASPAPAPRSTRRACGRSSRPASSSSARRAASRRTGRLVAAE